MPTSTMKSIIPLVIKKLTKPITMLVMKLVTLSNVTPLSSSAWNIKPKANIIASIRPPIASINDCKAPVSDRCWKTITIASITTPTTSTHITAKLVRNMIAPAAKTIKGSIIGVKSNDMMMPTRLITLPAIPIKPSIILDNASPIPGSISPKPPIPPPRRPIANIKAKPIPIAILNTITILVMPLPSIPTVFVIGPAASSIS